MQSSLPKKFLFVLISGFIGVTAVAGINAMDGSFRYDLNIFSQGPPLRISYNSRSLHQGVFGVGWCANFEKKVIFRQNSYWLSDCNLPSPQKITFLEAKKIKNFDNKYLSKKIKIQKTEQGYVIENGQQKIDITITQHLLKSIQGNKTHLKFQYDKNLNLSILENKNMNQLEMILFDDHDRVISHQYSSGCFDKIQYEKNQENQFTTVVERSCQRNLKPLKKEKILYVFSINLNKKQQRQISSVKIRKEDTKPRMSQLP